MSARKTAAMEQQDGKEVIAALPPTDFISGAYEAIFGKSRAVAKFARGMQNHSRKN